MYFFTHLYISKTLYSIFKDKVDLHKRSFAYGNIKPDLPNPDHKHHTMENYIFVVRDQTRSITNDSLSNKEFSICLGEICHYVCDFFCYYHTNESLHNKMLRHFFYELFMYFSLIRMKLNNKLIQFQNQKNPDKDPLTILLDMRKSYNFAARNMKTDMEYAFATCIWLLDSIVYALHYDIESQITVTSNTYILSPTEENSL